MNAIDKRIHIIQKAEVLFAKNGFSGTSVREIAEAAEVNVAMISYYFGSKQKLLLEIFNHRNDYLHTQVDDLLSNDSISWWDKMDLFIDHYVDKFVNNRDLHRIIIKETSENENEELQTFIDERKKAHYKLVSNFIQQGQDDGLCNAEIDIEWLYTLLPATAKHMLLNIEFMKSIIEEKQGIKPTDEEIIQLTKDHLKQFFRKILDIK